MAGAEKEEFLQFFTEPYLFITHTFIKQAHKETVLAVKWINKTGLILAKCSVHKAF